MAAIAAGQTVLDMVSDYYAGAVLKAMLVGSGWTVPPARAFRTSWSPVRWAS